MKKIFSIVLLLLSCSLCCAGDYTEDSSCKAAWLFTEGAGTTVADATGNGNTGNFKGAGEPAWDATDVSFGVSGSAPNSVLFDGDGDDDDYITIPDLDVNGDFTVCLWAKVTDKTAGATMIAQGDSSDWNMLLSNDTDGYATVKCVSNVPTEFSVTGTTDISGAWHHICGVKSGTTLTLYVDASSEGTPDTLDSSTLRDAGDSLLGRGDWGETVRGYMTEVAIFNTALSQSIIQEIYNYGLEGSSSVRRILVQ